MLINLRQVQTFLSTELPSLLKKDLRSVRIVKEADLECCVYYHLRQFLRGDDTWRFFARKHSRHTGFFIDLIIFRRAEPRVAIELKWDQPEISEKDRLSLRAGLKKLRVGKVYFINTTIGNRQYRPIKKNKDEKNSFFDIVVPLSLSGKKLDKWRQDRRRYTSQMAQRNVPN